MIYIVFNRDGSIKSKFLNEFIQQGNAYENELFVAVDNANSNDYVYGAVATLPDKTQITLTGEAHTETISEQEYIGYIFNIPADVTILSGVLKVSAIVQKDSKVLVSYPIYLTINETGLGANDPVFMTVSEYEGLIDAVNSQRTNYVPYTGAIKTIDINSQILKGLVTPTTNDAAVNKLYADTYFANELSFLSAVGGEAISIDARLVNKNGANLGYNHRVTLNKADTSHAGLMSAADKVELNKVSGKVDKTSSAFKVYATDELGDQTTLPYDELEEGQVVRRTDMTHGNIVVGNPRANNHAANKQYVDTKVAEFAQNEMQVVESLPLSGEEGIIYLVPIDPNDATKGYYRYIWENNSWLALGTTEIDLSDYQEKLVSGINIKTINNESLLGSGNIALVVSADLLASDSDIEDIMGA